MKSLICSLYLFLAWPQQVVFEQAAEAYNAEEYKKAIELYESVLEEGASEYHVEKSKKESASMKSVIGDPDRIKAIAEDFVQHYEKRVSEGSSVKGKAMFVCSAREIAFDNPSLTIKDCLYQENRAMNADRFDLAA